MASLEYELSKLESEIAQSETELEQAREEEQSSKERLSVREWNQAQIKDLAAARPSAEKSRAKYTTLQGISRWTPGRLTEHCMSFTSISPFPESSAAISFDISRNRSIITCQAKLELACYRHRLGHTTKLTKASAKFLKRGIAALLKHCANSSLVSPADIGPAMQLLDWHFGRVEQAATELAKLESNYKVDLFYTNESEVYMDVEICGRNGAGKLRANFELSPTYPFSPLNVQVDVLDGEIDVRKLQRRLIKQAKPGFGYLTRTCDCIAAFIS